MTLENIPPILACPNCGYDGALTGLRVCPYCNGVLSQAAAPNTLITVDQDIGQAQGGQVIGVNIGQMRDSIINLGARALTVEEAAKLAVDIELELLAHGVGELLQRLAAQIAVAPAAGSPYKGLLAYSLGDAGRFHGRAAATAALLNLLGRGQLTVLHAESGAGKSSLLQAGIAARLVEAGHLAVYLRPYRSQPVATIKEAFLDLGRVPRLASLPLRDFLRYVTDILGPGKTLYLLFDQFEEFFAYLDLPARSTFAAELGACLHDESLGVRWVIALRGEALSRLAEMEASGVEPFENQYRLARLTRDEAREVITGPGFAFAPGLVETILDSLIKNGEVVPPQLQLVCLALTDGLAPPAAVGRERYDALGGAEGILRDYLLRQVQGFPQEEREPVRRLLRTLVTADGRRAVLAKGDLANAWQVQGGDRALLDTLIVRLVERRLVVIQERSGDGEHLYELAHDTLLREIQLDPAEQARKAAQEMLGRAVLDYQTNPNLRIPTDRLEYIYSQRNDLVLDTQSQELLLRSSLQVDFQTRYWLEQINDPDLKLAVLSQSARGDDPEMRTRAAQGLGILATPKAADLLLTLALDDPDRSVRHAIRQLLPQSALDQDQIARRLEEQTRNGDPVRQQRAVELLASMPLDAVPASVRWRVWLTRGRLAVQNLYEKHLAAPERRVALGIAILLLFVAGVAYLALSANYFVTQSSRTLTPGESVAVVRGHPNFRLGEDVIVTDFRRPDFPAASMDTINHSELRGYGWPWRLGDDGYLQQLLPLLSPEPAARSRWFLGDGQKAALVSEMAGYLGTDIKPFGMNVLEQMMTLDPSLATGELFETTQSLFQDQNPVVRQEATHLIYRLCDLEPSLAPDCMRFLLNQVNIDRSDAVHREIMAGMAGLLADQEAPLAPDLAAGLVQLLMHRNYYDVYRGVRSLVAQAAEKHPESFLSNEVVTEGYQPLLQYLRSPVPEERERAADALYVLAQSAPGIISPELSDLLLSRLVDPEAPVRASVANTLGMVATQKPAIAPTVVQPLLELLTDSDERVQQYAVEAVARTAEADPSLAPAIIRRLYGFLTYQNDRVMEHAASALAQVARSAGAPNTAANLLYDERSSVRDGALTGLRQWVGRHPEAFSADMAWVFVQESMVGNDVATSLAIDLARRAQPGDGLDVLISYLFTNTRATNVGGYRADLLKEISRSLRPDAAASAVAPVLQDLIDWSGRLQSDLAWQASVAQEGLTDPEYIQRSINFDRQQLQTNTSLLANLISTDADNIPSHVELLTQLSYDSEYHAARSALMTVLAEVMLRHPQLIPPSAYVALADAAPASAVESTYVETALSIGAISDPQILDQWDRDQLLAALENQDTALRALAPLGLGYHAGQDARPPEQLIRDIRKVVLSSESKQHASQGTAALAHVYAALQRNGTESVEQLFSRLTDPVDPVGRAAAARALFLIALHEPAQQAAIAQRLATFADHDSPIDRIWASTTLQLLRIADLAKQAGDDPKIQQATLDRLCELQKGAFFGPESSWAAAYARFSLLVTTDRTEICK